MLIGRGKIFTFHFQIGQPQPHDGAAAAAALQRVALSLLARHHRARGAADRADGASGRSQPRR